MTTIVQIAGDDSGATAIEYSLIAALIGVAIIGAMNAFGAASGRMWDYVMATLATAAS